MKKTISNIARIIIGVGAVVLLLSTQDISELAASFSKIKPLMFFAAVALFLIAQSMVGIRWKYLLSLINIKVSSLAAVKLTYVGFFYNNVMLSFVGGDVLRAWYITHHTSHKKMEAAFSVIVDRFCGLASSLLLAGIGLLYSYKLLSSADDSSKEIRGLETILLAGASALVLAVAVFFLIRKTAFMQKLWAKIRHKVLRLLEAVKVYAGSPFKMFLAIVFTLLIQLCSISGFYLVCSSAGIEADFRYYAAFFPLCWMIGSLPISPGGLGVLEVGISAAFSLLPEVSPEQAVTIALCQRLVLLVGSLPGLAIHLSGLHMPAEAAEELKNEDIPI
ncbi:lysylphosphatidylglycerol synthase transmembrane domain-containing protein [Sedimentisphaera salicampi]|uniref:Flippase-like domain-containing protein n=1 Tax=Sedimentisphaera salicampi TaxID=1941349 RepID=A0A1W6LMD1_9BACT|nr:lysylphosphatidylglycerol synthase transmembrane domain-containing protein [Sedimentisphaera salicampi]ARN56948.1 hypothetical protein STSP1_01341 [Sedimentisphaera salicampi]OXU15091.1 hypothetical protein SMSP1_01286 [Sedimentisphaera salicampi]